MLPSKLDNAPAKVLGKKHRGRLRLWPQGHLHTAIEQEDILRLEAEEEARLLDEQTTSLDRELEHDENREGLRGCAWPKWFLHKSLHVIVAAATLPPPNTIKDFALGLWQ